MKNLSFPTREQVEQIINENEYEYTIHDEYKEEIDIEISRIRNNAIISVSFDENTAIIIVKADWSI